jgi:adenylate cyclase
VTDAAIQPEAAQSARRRVLHYCGHMFGADEQAESRVRARIEAVLDEEGAGSACGGLACGADILCAEALLARGAALTVVLPFAEEDFLAQSVRPGGSDWEPRFRACRDSAERVVLAGPPAYAGGAGQYRHASRTAMGMARLLAGQDGAEAVQLAVWDGASGDGLAGTAADAAAWAAAGGRTRVVDPGAVARDLRRPRVDAAADGGGMAAILCVGGLEGAGLRAAEAVLDARSSAVEHYEARGDGLRAIARGAPAAAALALELEALFARLAPPDSGDRGLRIVAHYGPAFACAGQIATWTALPRAGALLVTEPFAAILALEAGDRFALRHAGSGADPAVYRLSAGRGGMVSPAGFEPATY